MIRHTVVFRLRHPAGSAEEADFLRTAEQQLAPIQGVQRFEVLRQTGAKSAYRFSLSMEFADAAAYAGYNGHPSHVGFVQGRWIPEVEEFQELDFERYDGVSA
jgi:Stress responsive A/B Barrel Domain